MQNAEDKVSEMITPRLVDCEKVINKQQNNIRNQLNADKLIDIKYDKMEGGIESLVEIIREKQDMIKVIRG